jgi:hypothetical protein
MASPDDPEATAEAEWTVPADSPRVRPQPLSADSIELPVYRPRRRTRVVFWSGFVVAAVVAVLVVWLVLA